MKRLVVLLFLVFSLKPDQPIDDLKALTEDEFDAVVYSMTRVQAEVLTNIKKKHFKITNLQEAMEKSLETLLSELDAHSGFLRPDAYKSMMDSTSGEFHGIGIMIDNTRKPKDKQLTIVDTIPDGPSDRVGIKPLDKIVEIEDHSLEGITTEEAIAKLKGPKNSKVTVKVLREGYPDLLTFDIIRDTIKEQNSLSFYLKDYNIYYLSLNMFTSNAVNQIESLLKKAQKNPYKGLILDLRNNSGGLLSAAIDIAGLFVEKGTPIVTTKNNKGAITETYKTRRDPITNPNLPIIVLINNFTASAAEILASVLKSYSDGKVVKTKQIPVVMVLGTQSFGKGSVQEIIPVSNNCAMKTTTHLYYPCNENIQGQGIKPDFLVDRMLPQTEQMKWFIKTYGRESALPNTIKVEASIKPETTDKNAAEKQKNSRYIERAHEMLKNDNQVREAINILNTYDVLHQVCPTKLDCRTNVITMLKKTHMDNDNLHIEELTY